MKDCKLALCQKYDGCIRAVGCAMEKQMSEIDQLKNCPACKETLVFPRESYPYCEECGWPDEDFGEEYGYPEDGDRLEKFQPGLQFYNEKLGTWVPSGVITATFREVNDRGFYRYPIKPQVKYPLTAENEDDDTY